MQDRTLQKQIQHALLIVFIVINSKSQDLTHQIVFSFLAFTSNFVLKFMHDITLQNLVHYVVLIVFTAFN